MTETSQPNTGATELKKFRQAIFVNGKFSHWHYWGFIEEHGNLTFVAPEMNLTTIEEAYKNSYQCVGVKDIDSEVLYRGDILKDNYDRILLVEWYRYSFSFKAITEANFLRAQDIAQWFEFEDVGALPKIIGNIIENPELVDGVMTDV